MKNNEKTFSLIPYLIKCFRIFWIKNSRGILTDKPGEEKRDLSLWEVIPKMLKSHPNDDFSKPKNMNLFGEFFYFIFIQFIAISPIIASVLALCITLLIKTLQILFVLIITVVLMLYCVFQKIILKVFFKKNPKLVLTT